MYIFKGTMCSFLGILLSKINIFINKYALNGVQIPLPMIRLILVNEEFIIFIYMGRVGPRRLPCSSAILKNYNSREGQKVLGQRVSITRFRSEPESRDWSQQKRRSRAVRGACHCRGKFKRMHCTVIYTSFIHTYAESQDESSSSKKSKIDRKRKRDRRLQKQGLMSG